MLEAIKNFPRQFTYRPIIKNKKNYKKAKRFILLGMGGSHLAADLINNWEDTSNFILIHKNYGLPNIPDKELGQHLIIASSYSGNTEEVVDGLKKALQKKYKIIVIATGGKLIALAKKYKLPYIQMPATGIQPRSALGFSCRALLKAIGQPRALKETASLAQKLKPAKYQKRGQKIAKQLKNYLPVIYSSDRNISLAYNWKIKLNETGKIPAFYNVFPELNHNEMNGFDPVDQTKKLSRPFYFIFLQDDYDHTKVINRSLWVNFTLVFIESKPKRCSMFSF